MLYILVKLYVLLQVTATFVWLQESVYISRSRGNDNTSCRLQFLPCRTISYALHQAAEGSHIYLDGADTLKDPYICQPLDPGHPESFLTITKIVSFIAIGSRAHISCRYWLVNGTRHKDGLHVFFHGLAFHDTALRLLDTSVTISDSLFLDTQYGSMNFLIFNLARFDLILSNVVFKNNTFCMFVNCTTSANLSFSMTNSSFLQNGNRDSSTLPSPSILWVESKKSNIDINVRNCSFKKNSFNKMGVRAAKNTQAMTNLLLGQTEFEQSGYIGTLSRKVNGILFFHSAHVTMTFDFGFIHSTFGTFLTFIGQSATVKVSNTIVEKFYGPDKGGAAFDILAKLSAFLSIKDSCFRNGKSISRGGVLSIIAPDLTLTIENSTIHNISNPDGDGSVLLQSSDKPTSQSGTEDCVLRLNIINSTFSDCISVHGGAVYVFAKNLILTVIDSWFVQNSVKKTGGALYFVTFGTTAIHLQNVYFLENTAGHRGIIAGKAAGHESMFSFTSNNVSFFHNNLRSQNTPDDGIMLHLEIQSKISDLNFKSTGFIQNTGFNSSAVYLFLSNASSSMSHFITVDSCVFQQNFAIASLNVYGKATVDIRIINSTFVNNSHGTILLDLNQRSCFRIEDSKFFRNRYIRGPGGAISIQVSNDDKNRKKPYNQCANLNYNAFIKNVSFQENVATIGVVLTITNAKIEIVNSEFLNNFVRTGGGQIASVGSTDMKILNSVFKQTIQKITVKGIEFVVSSLFRIYSSGELLLLNSTVDLDTISNEPLILATRSFRVTVNRFSVISCPQGSALTKNVYHYNEHMITVFGLVISCVACDYNFYSLQKGQTKGLDVDDAFRCMPCPRGADCISNIKSKPNFWGYNASSNPPILAFTLCPFGYCKSPQADSSKYNDCQGRRTGVMCGSCSNGYSEALWSTHCTPIKDCNASWFWILFLILVLFMAILLVFKPPFLTYLLKHLLWFKRFTANASNSQEFRHNNVCGTLSVSGEGGRNNILLSSREQIINDKRQFSRFLEIIFYFYQIAKLLLSSYSLGEYFDSKIFATVLGFFNFEPRLQKHDFLCPFPGLTPKTKLAFKILPVFGTMLAISTIYFSHFFFNILRRSRRPSVSPYLQASIKTIFLGYTTLATVGISLIRCVPVAGEDRWFYNGNVICYQWWQCLSFTFNGIFVIPLIFVLAWASFKVHHSKITVKQFLLAIVFPLPLLLLWLLRIVCPSEAVNVEESEKFCAIKEMLLGPYKQPGNGSKYGAMYWQSVLIARRFILVLIFCTVTEPSIRLFCMTLACVLVLFFHLKVKPFRNALASNLESLSLLLLVVLGLINLLKSVFVGFEGIVKGPLVTFFKVFQWLEIIILGLFPALLSFLVCFAIISLILRALFMCCKSLFKFIFKRCAQRSLSQDTSRLINIFEDINRD